MGVFLVFTNRESCPGNRPYQGKHAEQHHQKRSTAVVLDPAKVANQQNDAGRTLTEWFENTANPGRYGLDMSEWNRQIALGKEKGDWSY